MSSTAFLTTFLIGSLHAICILWANQNQELHNHSNNLSPISLKIDTSFILTVGSSYDCTSGKFYPDKT